MAFVCTWRIAVRSWNLTGKHQASRLFSTSTESRPIIGFLRSKPILLGNTWRTNYRRLSVSAKSATSDDGVHCWKCGSVVAQTHVLFCGECRVVQKPAPGADYFEILGVEADFDLDVKQLTNKFRLLQMQLHPDRFSTRTEEEKEVSATFSSLLNRAYKTLQSPMERGLYLLKLAEHPLHDGQVEMEPAFFMEIMEINEELAELADEKSLIEFSAANQAKMSVLFGRVSKSFSARDWPTARQLMGQLKYLNNIQDKVRDKEREWGVVRQ